MMKKFSELLAASVLCATCVTSCGEEEEFDFGAVDPVDLANKSYSQYDDDAHRLGNFDVLHTVYIRWDGTSVSVTGDKVSGVSVSANGGAVVVNNNADGTEFVLEGSSADGSIKFYGNRAFLITLEGLNLTSQSSPAINNQGSKTCFISMANGKSNILADAEVYRDTVAGEDCKACLFSEGEIVFCGNDALSVIGRHRHAIATDDYLVMNEEATVIVLEAARDAIHTNEFVHIEGGALTIIDSGADGIDCGGSLSLSGGAVSITTSATKGKCIKTVGDVWVSGGTLALNNSGDALWNAGTGTEVDYSCAACLKTDGSFSFMGGNIKANATGRSTRGIHVKRDFIMSGGVADVTASGDAYQIDTLSDFTASNGLRVKGNMSVTGGKFVANASGAGAMAVRVKGDYTQSGGLVKGSASGTALGRIRELWKRPEDMTAEELRHLLTVNRDHSWRPKASAKGIKVKGVLTVRDGQLYGESESNEAIEAKQTVNIDGGEVYARSGNDDGINASSHINIRGGVVCGYTVSNDGIDSNGNIYITGGLVFSTCLHDPEVAIDANTEGGYKLYVWGGTIITCGPLEGGADLSQNCYIDSTYINGKSYELTVGNDSYVFTTPSSIDAGSGIVVSGPGSYMPVLLEDVTVTGGTKLFDGEGTLIKNGSVSGGVAVPLYTYTAPVRVRSGIAE